MMIAIDRSVFARYLSRGSETRLVYVAKPSHAHAGHTQEITHQLLPTAAGANNAKADLVRRRDRPPRAGLSNAAADNRGTHAARLIAFDVTPSDHIFSA